LNRSQKLGLVFLAAVLLYLALLLLGSAAGQFVFPGDRPGWETAIRAATLLLGVMMTAFTVGPYIWRGEPAVRWLLFAGVAMLAVAFAWVAGIMAAPLPDPAEQAKWERNFWWVVPLTWGMSAGCLAGAALLLTPQVGAFFLYRRGKSATAA
jgi:hypothetical protein